MNSKIQYYGSPRWTNEIVDCSLPVTFDTYSKCSFKCLYCFSQYQKGCGKPKDEYYNKDAVRYVNVDKIRDMFTLKKPSQFSEYISTKRPIQWGGLADQFDGYEKKYGKTLELLKIFKELNYPICFSTKSTWWLKDERYTELFRNQKNWNCKFSIITMNKEKARIIEQGVPSPKARIDAIQKYTELNAGGATLRLRPFIIGVSDDYEETITEAHEAGATALSTEFFCVDIRSKQARENFKIISKVCGYDVLTFYKRFSVTNGYLRLNRKIKEKYIYGMKELCEKLGMRFYVSDSHFKELCNNSCCCGLPESWDYSRGNFSYALQLCRKNGSVRFSEIDADMHFIDGFQWYVAEGYNTYSAEKRGKFANMTMRDYLRYTWDNVNSGNSPYRLFQGVMIPDGYDENGDVIYKYNGEKRQNQQK